ncbi:MAG: AAA family ATPase [Planctomycetota bacterium]|jgi:hypothetical protein|nr:AAA family ATPase [Planctomycetota bacterium]
MRSESIRLKNFQAFREATFDRLPRLCVVVGANGTGKSTLFNIFFFLKDALTDDLGVAFARMGGRRGFADVRSRDSSGPIEIELKFHFEPDSPLATYFLAIDEENGKLAVVRETLSYRRGSAGKPRNFLDFRELESWYLADLEAVERGLGIAKLGRQQNKKKYRNPDSLAHPKDELQKLTSGCYQGIGGSRTIAPHLDIKNKRSSSFAVFLSGIAQFEKQSTRRGAEPHP